MSIDIKIEFTINDILLNQESLQKKNKYSCPICFEFIYKKSIYQCKSGHWACQKCWETSLKIKRECMICRSKVNLFQDLSRCLVIEQGFGIKECSYEENGCKEILKVEDLDTHIQNCKFKLVKCPNKGCDKVLRLNSFSEHENECTFKLATCEFCKKDDVKKDQLDNHHSECPKVKIDCIQNCQVKIERDETEGHIEHDCNNTIVNCKYHEQENVNHQIYMTKLIEKLISKVDQSNIIINDLKKKLELEFNPNVYKNKWIISDFSLYAILVHNSNGNRVKFECWFKLVNVLDSSKSMIVNLGEIVYKEPMGWDYCNFLINSSSINKENGWVSNDDKLTIEIYFKILGQTFETLES
ncbi:hypothetical protein ACTFIW_008979 [Dictyostelium discoideum]